MRRKTIIVLVITLMVTVLVSAFSYLYISQILRLRIVSAYETATSLTHQLAYAAGNVPPGAGGARGEVGPADSGGGITPGTIPGTNTPGSDIGRTPAMGTEPPPGSPKVHPGSGSRMVCRGGDTIGTQ